MKRYPIEKKFSLKLKSNALGTMKCPPEPPMPPPAKIEVNNEGAYIFLLQVITGCFAIGLIISGVLWFRILNNVLVRRLTNAVYYR